MIVDLTMITGYGGKQNVSQQLVNVKTRYEKYSAFLKLVAAGKMQLHNELMRAKSPPTLWRSA